MLAKAEQYDRGLSAIDEALSAVAETNERYHEAELYRLKGVLLLGQGRAGAAERAETDFQTSLKIARTGQTKMLELRAATSTAQLYLATGRAREAFDVLGTIYVWFDDGLESKDLKDAGRLLTKISGLL